MAKRKAKDGDQVGAKRGRKPKSKTVLEFAGKPNGGDGSPAVAEAEGITNEIRMAIAEEDLGPIVLPSPEDSQRVLKELAGLQSLRYRWAKIHGEHHEKAKTAKGKVDALDEQISERIRIATHESDLPLFSQDQAEADVSRIEEQASQPAASVLEGAPEAPVPAPLALPEGSEKSDGIF